MSDPLVNEEIQEGKFFAVISYISFLCVVSLILKKDNKFVLYHAKQGLVLFVIEVVSFILSVIPLLQVLIKTLGFSVFVLVSLWGIFNAIKGNCIKIPFVSRIAEKVIL
ncbi:MAG: hypothetical protein HY761_07590 [Candidatus Omnitrophica bacterium]|nr:hypothetical protein [Candidatus Omnitrophota bacterium]